MIVSKILSKTINIYMIQIVIVFQILASFKMSFRIKGLNTNETEELLKLLYRIDEILEDYEEEYEVGILFELICKIDDNQALVGTIPIETHIKNIIYYAMTKRPDLKFIITEQCILKNNYKIARFIVDNNLYDPFILTEIFNNYYVSKSIRDVFVNNKNIRL